MLEPVHDLSLSGQLVFLGTGTSVGVPAIGCGCGTCTSSDPRNNRLRSSVLFGLPEGYLLIDTTPDLRTQLLREKIGLVHSVAYTHTHADHVFGLDDLRLFPFYLGHPVPIYCEAEVETFIRNTFSYAFLEAKPTHAGATPKLDLRQITTAPFETLGTTVTPLRLQHGRFDTLGFRVGNVAYCTDTNGIPPESLARLEGLDVLILDALRQRPHPTHYCLEESIAVAEQIGARRTIFTHISHEMEHAATAEKLPPGMELAQDGLRVPLV